MYLRGASPWDVRGEEIAVRRYIWEKSKNSSPQSSMERHNISVTKRISKKANCFSFNRCRIIITCGQHRIHLKMGVIFYKTSFDHVILVGISEFTRFTRQQCREKQNYYLIMRWKITGVLQEFNITTISE